MKRLILALGIVLVMVLTLVAPAFSSYNPDDGPYDKFHGQTWYLFHAQDINNQYVDGHPYIAQRNVVPNADPPELGSLCDSNLYFVFSSGQKIEFYADESANADVSFNGGSWLLNLAVKGNSNPDWGDNISGRIGYYNGANPTWLGTFDKMNDSRTTGSWVEINANPTTIPEGCYLVVELTNNGPTKNILQSDGTNLNSPQTDAGYPLPEIAAGIMLGGGLLGLGGFVWIRRKKSATVI
jgi:hypothetical protein